MIICLIVYSKQDGLWVPDYVVNGDEAKGIEAVAPDLKTMEDLKKKGIEAVAPDLKTMEDLKKYVDVFKDPDDPTKGVIQIGVEGWTANPDIIARMEKYDLASVYNYKTVATEADIPGNVEAKIAKGEPIVFYDYMPAGLLGKYNFIHIQDPVWESNPAGVAMVCASANLKNNYPDVYTFLENFELDLQARCKALAAMEATGASFDDYAKQWLTENPDAWKAWVTEDAAAKIEAALGQ